jgi:hypothetical protein
MEIAMPRRLFTLFFALAGAAQAFGQFTITTIAGSRSGGGWQDGALREAKFELPQDVAVDRGGNLYVTDFGNLTIRRLGRDGQVTTIAGGVNVYGSADGPGPSARFEELDGITVDPSPEPASKASVV